MLADVRLFSKPKLSYTYNIPHRSSTRDVHAGIVGPLNFLDRSAVLSVAGAIEEMEI